MKLRGKDWADTARKGLEKLIARGAGKGLPAVFDFDNTILCGDIGEATLAMLARDGTVTKDSVPAQIAPPFLSSNGREVMLTKCPDITVYYEELLAATGHAGGDTAPLSNGYVWAAEIMQGLRPLDVARATEKVHSLSAPGKMRMLEAVPGGNAYQVPFFYPEMIELLAILLKERFEVWIVSASNVWSVRWMVLKALNRELEGLGAGPGIKPEQVIGVSTLLRDRRGRLFKDHLLANSDSNYAALDEDTLAGLTLTGMLNFPAPVYSGKVANILDRIGVRPHLAAGDSPGDLPMLGFSEHRLWISRLEKPEYQREFSARADRDSGENWIVQPALSKDHPCFIGGSGNPERIFNGAIPGPAAESVSSVKKFL